MSNVATTDAPPALLRYKVHGSEDLDTFLEVGARCRDDLVAALATAKVELGDAGTVLDFGCGCGRVLSWLADLAPAVKLHGTDIDEEAIAWCRDNLGFASFDVNDRRPPLRYQSGGFDVVYAISVLTHLDEPDQLAWLEEWHRVTRPGGLVVATVHGPARAAGLLDEAQDTELRERGFLFVECEFMDGLFPKWYQISYQSQEYVERVFQRWFSVCAYLPKAMNDDQDVVVLRKESSGTSA